MKKCANCERTIGNLEPVCTWEGHAVCRACFNLLNEPGASQPSEESHKPPIRNAQGWWKAFSPIVTGAVALLVGLFILGFAHYIEHSRDSDSPNSIRQAQSTASNLYLVGTVAFGVGASFLIVGTVRKAVAWGVEKLNQRRNSSVEPSTKTEPKTPVRPTNKPAGNTPTKGSPSGTQSADDIINQWASGGALPQGAQEAAGGAILSVSGKFYGKDGREYQKVDGGYRAIKWLVTTPEPPQALKTMSDRTGQAVAARTSANTGPPAIPQKMLQLSDGTFSHADYPGVRYKWNGNGFDPVV